MSYLLPWTTEKEPNTVDSWLILNDAKMVVARATSFKSAEFIVVTVNKLDKAVKALVERVAPNGKGKA